MFVCSRSFFSQQQQILWSMLEAGINVVVVVTVVVIAGIIITAECERYLALPFKFGLFYTRELKKQRELSNYILYI